MAKSKLAKNSLVLGKLNAILKLFIYINKLKRNSSDCFLLYFKYCKIT